MIAEGGAGMSKWVLEGLRTGVKSSRYPRAPETAAGVSPGRPASRVIAPADVIAASCCPTGAITVVESTSVVDYRKCVHCQRCQDAEPAIVDWQTDYEWATTPDTAAAAEELRRQFRRSLHIRFVDAGACGACMSEARQLNNPYYNMHRPGFFFTPTPRNADVLMVAGPVTQAMWHPLRDTYEAMPRPKRVLAIGVCAISGGVFGPNPVVAGGAAEALPVDVIVPGCPPPPLAILHGLLVLVRRKPPRPLMSVSERETVMEPAT
jgi:Ni,Fe-hydrogenase III small subunit